ncbi:zinc-binding dehydrogenase [Nocardia acidivorans]|uniref:zinc-binding dehydrogenase n=1 Tax=Nocardia acidivorans TaxID=404580 RepID=UPI00082A7A71|nr:zinc-binding dehydrogenase [Nocardia acidivorans]
MSSERVLAVVATHSCPDRPLDGLRVGPWRAPAPRPDGVRISIRAAGLNHHDLWTLRGIGVTGEQLPVVLGAEGAGIDEDGNPVIVYPVVGDPAAGGGDETLDPAMGMLSSDYDGTFAEQIVVPRRNVVPKPDWLSFEEAACLPGAWLTAYRMLFHRARLAAGSLVLVQGAGGGVATALIMLAHAANHRVWVTSRSPEKRRSALELGAERVFETGTRLPARVDAVLETVGAATWEHSVRAVRPGGVVVVSGATTGHLTTLDLNRLFYRQISIVGSTVGTREELLGLTDFCARTGLRPRIHQVLPLARAREGFTTMLAGEQFGKIVLAVGRDG